MIKNKIVVLDRPGAKAWSFYLNEIESYLKENK